MFKQLRIRLLTMNLVMISIVMMASFLTIYLVTYNNIKQDIDRDLYRVAEFRIKDGFNPANVEDALTSADMNLPDNFVDMDKPPMDDIGIEPERSISFAIYTDSDYAVLKTNSFFDAEDSFFSDTLKLAIDNQKTEGQFTYDNSEWAYLIIPSHNGYTFSFLDISNQQAVLDRLIYTFALVTLLTIIFIIIISNILTNRSVAPIKEAFEKQKQFISDASHELKTPLAVINTNVDVLLSNQDPKTSLDYKWLHYIKTEVNRMSKLTNDLLYLTKMESAEKIAVSFDLSEKLEHQMLGLEAVAYENDIALTYEIAPSIMMTGVAEQIEQVSMILMDNALKYTPEKGKVHLKLWQSNHHIHLIVTNTGEGIPERDLTRIFDRFYRREFARTRDSQSYGLGLPIAKAIVEAHGGKITCESKEGESTTFSVKLT